MQKSTIWLAAILIGIVDALLLCVFEFVGVDVTAWLWSDVFHTDTYRWLVIPVAIGLGLLFTLVIKLLGNKRVVPVEVDLMNEINTAPSTLAAIGVVLAIGAMSLLAGASLGPEAALMSASAAIGAYAAAKLAAAGSVKQTLILASVGALLVAFVGSLLLVLIPLLILIQGAKKQQLPLKTIGKPAAIIFLAGFIAFITNEIINVVTGKVGGYGTLPALPGITVHDFVVAVLVGFIAGGLAASMTWLIKQFGQMSVWLNKQRIPAKDWILSIGFSVVIGLIYLVGGQTIQFSGSIGSHLLMENAAQFGVAALGIMVVSKILATAWSKGTGYRGGLVFPSIYIGIALGLLAGQFFPDLGGTGAILGAISGMLTASIGSPVMAGIFLLAFLPAKLEFYAVALCAIIGTVAFNLVLKRITKIKTTA